ncbi:MAG: hypothetical protein JW738_05720 [Actinobacteria bacterium]|nr:hypothetical protein [Actinomycetota bacterium]
MALESSKVHVGDEALEFCLPEGGTEELVCLSDFRGHKLLVIFLKGSW